MVTSQLLDLLDCLQYFVSEDLHDGFLGSLEQVGLSLTVLLPDVLECFCPVDDVFSENFVVVTQGFPDFVHFLRICSLLAPLQLADGLFRQFVGLKSPLHVIFFGFYQFRQF